MSAAAALVVHAPALEKLLDEAGDAPKPIPQLLARARSRKLRADCPWADPLGLPADLPAGPLARLGLHEKKPTVAPGEWWMCADAVELVPDLTAVWIRGPAALPRVEQDDTGPFGELAELFASEGLGFFPGNGRGALIRLSEPPECRFTPAALAYGKRLDLVLPAGAEARRWHRLFNECQMILQQHLAAPAATGPGCGLWFWGPGRMPERAAGDVRIDVEAAGDPVLEGLARWMHLESRSDAPPSARLVHWPADPEGSAGENLRRLAEERLGPAWSSLRSGRLRRLALTGSASVHELGRLGPWAFWRGPRARARA